MCATLRLAWLAPRAMADVATHAFILLPRLCWRARSFWSTAVENHSVQHAASTLGISPGAVYIARTRVMTRLRQRVQEITLDGIPEAIEAMEYAAKETSG